MTPWYLQLVSASTAMAMALRSAGATMPDSDLFAVADLHIRLAVATAGLAPLSGYYQAKLFQEKLTIECPIPFIGHVPQKVR